MFFFAGYNADHEGLKCYIMCDIKRGIPFVAGGLPSDSCVRFGPVAARFQIHQTL